VSYKVGNEFGGFDTQYFEINLIFKTNATASYTYTDLLWHI